MNRFTLRLGASLRNRIILVFLMIIIVPFLIFAYFAHIKSIEGITNTNTKISLSYLQQATNNFEIYLNTLNDQVNTLIGNKRVQDLLIDPPANPAEEEDFTVNLLTVLYQATPQIDAFRVRVYPINPSLYPSYMNTLGEAANITSEEWFKRSQGTVGPMWELFMPQQGKYGRPLLGYIKRFTGLFDRKPRGMVVTEISEDHLKRYFSPTEQLKNQKLLLMNRDGTIYYDSSSNEWAGNQFPSNSFVSHLQQNSQGSQTLKIDGHKYLTTYVSLDSEPWAIVSLTLLKELSGSSDEMTRLLIIFLIIYLICCFAVVFYITVYFTQPIARLVRLMRRMEEGNFQTEALTSPRRDEVGWLYRGVGSLVQRIDVLIQEAWRSERKKKALEFQVLSHQINPHFLYNTLESIRWKAENHGRSDISEMVSALGNLLRLSLNQGKEITTLRREIEQVKAYVLIEQGRMGKTIRILYSLDEDLLDFPFLRLLLQPLVENAIQHSVRSDFEKGKIIVSARREEEDMIIEIADNGKGIPQSIIDELDHDDAEEEMYTTTRRGVGLRNVNDRLKLYFGSEYKLQIQIGTEGGTRILLRHPMKVGEELSKTDDTH
ncbi:cache domain-containing sensor histidine kinase [Paenibacillus nitricinens]|uniref:cache domain-containing sensor histidine kinase n=1 Tax=Paenibacillus nitricinens TaxID=3367691 RepID=UPI003F857160